MRFSSTSYNRLFFGRSEGAAHAAGDDPWSARSSGPNFGAESGEKGTARLKSWHTMCPNSLNSLRNMWRLLRSCGATVPMNSEKPALVRELRRVPRPQDPDFALPGHSAVGALTPHTLLAAAAKILRNDVFHSLDCYCWVCTQMLFAVGPSCASNEPGGCNA